MSLMFIPGYTMDAGHFAIWVKQLQDARTELVAEAQGACLCLWYLLLACVGHCTFMLQCLLVDERGRVRVCVCVGCGYVAWGVGGSVCQRPALCLTRRVCRTPFPCVPSWFHSGTLSRGSQPRATVRPHSRRLPKPRGRRWRGAGGRRQWCVAHAARLSSDSPHFRRAPPSFVLYRVPLVLLIRRHPRLPLVTLATCGSAASRALLTHRAHLPCRVFSFLKQRAVAIVGARAGTARTRPRTRASMGSLTSRSWRQTPSPTPCGPPCCGASSVPTASTPRTPTVAFCTPHDWPSGVSLAKAVEIL